MHLLDRYITSKSFELHKGLLETQKDVFVLTFQSCQHVTKLASVDNSILVGIDCGNHMVNNERSGLVAERFAKHSSNWKHGIRYK